MKFPRHQQRENGMANSHNTRMPVFVEGLQPFCLKKVQKVCGAHYKGPQSG